VINLHRVAVLVGVAVSVLSHFAVGQQPHATQPTRFNAAAVVPFRDSFAIVFQGQAQGWQVYAMEKSDSGFRYIERFSAGAAKNWSSEVVLDSQLRAIREHSDGVLLGHSIGGDVRYVTGRATGLLTQYTDSGPHRVRIDTVLPTNAVDGNALMGLMLTLDWHLGASYALTIFDSDQASISTQMLRVTAEELITVPAGKRDVFRADLTAAEDTESAVRIWVTAAKPHRIVKIASAGDDLVTVLIAPRP